MSVQSSMQSYCPYCDRYIPVELHAHLEDCTGLKGRWVTVAEEVHGDDREAALDRLAETTDPAETTRGWSGWI